MKQLKGTPYRVRMDSQLGRGAEGSVHECSSSELPGQRLVCKIGRIQQASPHEMSLQQIIHVNIVRTVDVFESKTSVYTIMEDGGSSLAKLALERPFSQAELVQLVRQVALAHLEFERLGLVHSDIKPQNILLREGVFRLCDFSLARPEGQYKFAGTLEYSAPQYISDGTLTSKQDVFGLGAVLYFLIYHKRYCRNANQAVGVLQRARNITYAPCPQFEPDLLEALKGMLAFEPERRLSWAEIRELPFCFPWSQKYFKRKFLEVSLSFQHYPQIKCLREACEQQLNQGEYKVQRSQSQKCQFQRSGGYRPGLDYRNLVYRQLSLQAVEGEQGDILTRQFNRLYGGKGGQTPFYYLRK